MSDAGIRQSGMKQTIKRYPRKGPTRLMRTILLNAWVLIGWYIGNGVWNVVQLFTSNPQQVTSVSAVLYALALPGFLSNPDVPSWVYVLLIFLAGAILIGCLWALVDRHLENRASQNEGRGSTNKPYSLKVMIPIIVFAGLAIGFLTVPLIFAVIGIAQAISFVAVAIFIHPDQDKIVLTIILIAIYLWFLGTGLFQIFWPPSRRYLVESVRWNEREREMRWEVRRTRFSEGSVSERRQAEREARWAEREERWAEKASSANLHAAELKIALMTIVGTILFAIVILVHVQFAAFLHSSALSIFILWSTYLEIAVYSLVITYAMVFFRFTGFARRSAEMNYITAYRMVPVLVTLVLQMLTAIAFAALLVWA